MKPYAELTNAPHVDRKINDDVAASLICKFVDNYKNARSIHKETFDRCNTCHWVGLSSMVIETADSRWVCPSCGSEDVDDASNT